MRKLLWLAVVLLLSGCMVGPDYIRPEIDSPQNWTISYDAAANLADTAWWEQFGDAALNDLVAKAVKQNLDLQIATARVDRYLGQLRTSRAEAFPQIGATGGISNQQDTKNGLTPPGDSYKYYQANLNISWELDLWGRIRRANEAARAELLASEEGRRAVLLTLVSNVASNYLNLRGLDQQLLIAHETPGHKLEHALRELTGRPDFDPNSFDLEAARKRVSQIS